MSTHRVFKISAPSTHACFKSPVNECINDTLCRRNTHSLTLLHVTIDFRSHIHNVSSCADDHSFPAVQPWSVKTLWDVIHCVSVTYTFISYSYLHDLEVGRSSRSCFKISKHYSPRPPCGRNLFTHTCLCLYRSPSVM